MRRRITLCLFAMLFVLGCGDDDPKENNSDFGDCGVTVELSGAIEGSVTLDISDGCGGGGINATSVTTGFGLTGDYNIRVQLDELNKDELATGVPSTVVVVRRNADDSEDEWVTPVGSCATDMTTNSLREETIAGPSYNLAGTGECDPSTPAQATDQPDLVVGEYRFKSTALWND